MFLNRANQSQIGLIHGGDAAAGAGTGAGGAGAGAGGAGAAAGASGAGPGGDRLLLGAASKHWFAK